MTITVNEESRCFKDGATLQELLVSLELSETAGIAVAVNEAVITRTTWPECRLSESDQITIIQATQGG